MEKIKILFLLLMTMAVLTSCNSSGGGGSSSSGTVSENSGSVPDLSDTAEQVVSDTIDFYNNYSASTDFLPDIMNHADCNLASSYPTMKTLYDDRSINNFLTSGSYLSERTCLDRMVRDVMSYATSSPPFGLDRDDDILEVSGALDLTTSFFNVDGTLGPEEIEILELIFDDQV